jgi:serine protease
VGSVNEPNTGPRGNNNNGTTTLGDVDDWFRIDLVAGQVVELEFASDPASSDVDLYVVSADTNTVGASEGVDTRFECVAVTRSTSYYVVVSAYSKASIYNMRIGAPGSAANCAQRTASMPFVKGELIAEPLRADEGAAEKANALVRTARASVGAAALRAHAGPQLLHLPRSDADRREGLQALVRLAAGPARPGARVLASGGVVGRNKPAAEPWPEAMETLRFAKRLRSSGAFEYVEPNRYVQTTAVTGNFPPNDRLYSYQRWHYEQINVPSAMERIVGLNLPASQTRPLVAVIDDGIVSDHPDLAPQLYSAGRAFISVNTEGDADRTSAENLATAADQPVFHGTHVAGTVGAATFDGIGGAGTAPMAQLLPLRVFPANSGARSIDVIAAMRYAAGLSNRTGFVPTQARRRDQHEPGQRQPLRRRLPHGHCRCARCRHHRGGGRRQLGAQQLGRARGGGLAGQLHRRDRRQRHRRTPQDRQLLQHRQRGGGGGTRRRCFRLHHGQRRAGQRLQRHRHLRCQWPAPAGLWRHAGHFDGGAACGGRDGA